MGAKPGPLQILIVEDVADMRHLIAQSLAAFPEFKVSGLAQNTSEARVEIYRRRPDLILLDEILPGESSLDFLKEIKQLGIVTILMTSVSDPAHSLPPEAVGRIIKPGWQDPT